MHCFYFKALLLCLKESHKARTIFRKVGGFIYVMRVIADLESTLSDDVDNKWKDVDSKSILMLLISVFHTLTTAMRYEPANAKFFHQEVT